jgi:HSP90 family molecular chaperone
VSKSQREAKPATAKRQYHVTVAGQLFKHLGLQMYSGAVPAISELISNAYDGMAKNEWITIPTGRAIQTNDEIVVKDDGHGMSFQELAQVEHDR